MIDDIVTRLREITQPGKWQSMGKWDRTANEAADEIERLRKLAYLLIDELRFNGGYEAYTPKMLFDEFYEQAVRGE